MNWENENILPAELSAEEQIKILKAKIKDLERQAEDLKEFSWWKMSQNTEYTWEISTMQQITILPP